MRASITKIGTLQIFAESDMEEFALSQWDYYKHAIEKVYMSDRCVGQVDYTLKARGE